MILNNIKIIYFIFVIASMTLSVPWHEAYKLNSIISNKLSNYNINCVIYSKNYNQNKMEFIVTENRKKLTSNQAIEMTKKYLANKNAKLKFEFDHIETKNKKEYYVIHVYEIVGINTVTIGWYFVDIYSGKVFQWDLIIDELVEINS